MRKARLLGALVVLACAPCGRAASAAEQSSVLLYAPFEGSADAQFGVDPKAQVHDGAAEFAPGKRGQALLSGDAKAYVSFDAANIPANEGALEFWLKPVDWDAMFIREADSGQAPTQRRIPDWHDWIHLAVIARTSSSAARKNL